MFFSENELSLELIGAFKITRGEFSIKTPKVRDYDSLSIRLCGSGVFTVGADEYTVSRGDVLYMPKNASYEYRTENETIIALHFLNYSFRRGNTFELLKIDDCEHAEELFRRIYDVWKEKKSGYRYQCTALFYELLYYLHREEQSQSYISEPCIEKINEAVDYIHTHYRSETISISELCKRISVSETYFRKLFKRVHNESPKEYIIHLRLELASQLLQSQFYSITEVAEKAGFCDTKYFSRLFKKRYDVSPKKFQQDYESGLKIK